MMLLSSLLAILLLSQRTLAALTPEQVIQNINTVAKISSDTRVAIEVLSTDMDPAMIFPIGDTLARNLVMIVDNLTGDVTGMKETPPFDDDVALLIVDALTTFVQIHQDLLATIIGKHGIFAQFAITVPVLAALRSLEAIIDSFAFAMINMIPTRGSTVQEGKDGLDKSVGKTISLYSQICIPSPLYPTLMPICFNFP